MALIENDAAGLVQIRQDAGLSTINDALRRSAECHEAALAQDPFLFSSDAIETLTDAITTTNPVTRPRTPLP